MRLRACPENPLYLNHNLFKGVFIRGTKNIILTCVHLDDKGHSRVYGVVKKFIKDFQPDVVYLDGDFADCCSLSHWNLQKRRKMEGLRHKREISLIDKELVFLEKHCGKIVWLEGNHCNWVSQYLDKNPELEGLIEYQELLHLKERGIEWVPFNELLKVGRLRLTHGYYTNEHHAKKHLNELGCNVVYGHTHKGQSATKNMITQKPIKAWGLGCLCNKKPSYLKGKRGGWNHEFAVLYVATNGEFNLYPIDIINNRFYFNGKSYK